MAGENLRKSHIFNSFYCHISLIDFSTNIFDPRYLQQKCMYTLDIRQAYGYGYYEGNGVLDLLFKLNFLFYEI